MNKIYKVIWSKVRCAWVVVSEIARNHGAKGRSVHEGRKGASLLAGALLLGLLTGNGTAWAATVKDDYGIFLKGLTIGDSSNVTQGYLTSFSPATFWGSVTFYGDVTFAKGFSDLVVNGMHIDYNNASHSFSLGSTYHRNNTSDHAISLGEAYDSGDYSFVAGNQAQAGKYSVVIGSSANGNNPYTVVLGPNTQAASSSIVLGNNAQTYRNNGIAIGAAAVDASGNVTTKGALAGDANSIAIGTGSATNQGGNGNIAIGYMAQNTAGSDAIALGAFSKSDWHLNAGQQGYAPWEGSNTGNVDNSNFKNSLVSAVWKSTQGGLSIGDITGDKSTWITRQISGVAAGTQDTDAVNLAQLKASMTKIEAGDNISVNTTVNDDGSRTYKISSTGGSSGGGTHYVGFKKNYQWDSDSTQYGNYNGEGASAYKSSAMGINATATQEGATAVGNNATANGVSSVALGQDANTQQDGTVAVGHGAQATAAKAIAIGSAAKADGENSVHIGAFTNQNNVPGTVNGKNAVSIGNNSTATGEGAAAYGAGTTASGKDAIALGQESQSTSDGTVAIGYQAKAGANNALHSTAIGTSAETNALEGTALGYLSKVTANKGLALGSGASAGAENSVALGAGSQVDSGDTVGTASMSIKDTYGETSDSTTYQFAGSNPEGTVSVGHTQDGVDHTRTITHVAAGRVSSTSTDAINGSQLYGVTQSIEKVEQNVAKTATRYYSVNATDTGTGSNYLNDGAHGLNSLAAGNKAQAYGVGSLAIGYSSLAGSAANDATLFSSMAIGPYAKAQGTGAIAFGNSSSSSGFGGVALGGGANVSSYGGVALGGTSSATVTGGVALGTGSQASTAAGLAGYLSGSKKADQADSVWTSTIGAVSLGGGTFKTDSGEKIYTRQITNLAAGTKDTDAVNVAQLKALEQEGLSLTGNDNQKVTQSLGGNFNFTGGLTGDALKDGAASTANLGVRKNANGDGLEVVMTTTPSFDSVTAKNSITVKNASTADGTSDISLNGNGLFMGSKKITGLAAGTENTDAVNFGQLSKVSNELTAFENKTIQVGGNGGGTIARKLGENPILIQGTGTKDNANYSGTNLKTYVDENGVLQILLDKELVEDRIDVGSALAEPKDSRVNYPVVLGTDKNDATIGYVGINGKNGTSAVITSYAGSPIPGSDFNYTDSEGKSRMTRLEYTDQEGHAHHLATLTDGLSFGGDNSQVQIDSDSDTVSGTNVISRKLRATEPGKNATANYLQIKGGADATKLSDSNIGVQASSEDGSLTIKLSQELKGLTSAQFGTTTIDGSGLTLGTTGISLTASGLNNGGKKITNVKAGDISSTSTDAIIGSQLTNILNADGSAKGISFGAESAAGSHTNPTSVAIGGTVTLKGAGGDSSHKNLSTQVTEKGELTVTMAPEIQENKIYVGTQIPKENSPTGKVNYPIILGENTVGTDTYGYVGIKGKNNSQLYLTADQDASGSTRLDYLDTQNNAHLVALTSDGYTFAGDTGTANTLALNSTLSITGGIDQTENLTPGNIGVVSSGNGGLTVQLAKSLKGLTDATFNSGSAQTKIDASGVTAPAYKVGTKIYIDSQGLHANGQKVTAVQAGDLSADSTDAVNGSQLFATNQNVTKNAGDITDLTTRLDGAGMTFAGDSGTPVTKKLNETLTLTGGETSVDSLTQLSDKNIGLVADGNGKLEVRLAKDLTGLTGAAFSNGNFTTQLTGNGLTITPTSSGNAVNLTAQNLDLGGRQLHGVQAGEVTATSTDAVNGSQLHTVKETAENAQKEAQKHSTVSGSGNVDVAHSDNTDGSKNYTVSLKDTVTLGSNGTAITLDGTKGNASFGSGTTAVTVDGTTGAITGSSLLVSGNVQAGSVAVGNIHLNSTADAAHNIAADTITGLSNTSYTSTTQLVDSRAATEGELGDVIASIQNGSIVKGLLTTVKEGSNISVVADDKSDPSKTQYTIGLSPVLTGLTRAEFTNGKTGTEAQTAVLSSDGISLGSEDTSAQFTRTKVSAGNQQIQHVASGLNGKMYTDSVDNNAATVGDLKAQSQTLTDTGIVFAGNTGKETLALGKTAKIQGADLADGTTLAEDYTTANLTTVTAKAADGTVTTTIYGKKDMAGRSLSLGTQDANGAIANPVAVLKAQAASSTDTTQTGHLVLKGTKPTDTVTAADQTSADIYVQDGSDELQPADSKKMTRVMYADESTGTHELATLEDGLKFKGDDGNTSAVLLNGTLDVTGGADTGKLTAGNIGVTSDGKQGLTIALAKELKDLTSVAVTGEKFTTTLTGEGLTIAPAAGNSGGDSLVINASTGINLGNRKVTGLAAGTIGADSTDAVNGSQLHTVQEAANQAQIEAKKHSTVSVGDNNLVLTTTAENETKGADYALKLNNKITLGTGDNQVVLDGSDTGISSFGKQITLHGATGAVGVTSLTASGAVSASSVTVGDIILHSAADSTADPNVMKDTITGLGNTTYDDKNIVSNRAATEGQLQSLVSQINAGQISAGSTVVAGSSNISISSSKDDTGKITTYTASLTPELTGLTSAVFTNGKTGQEEETNTLTANGLTLGTDDGAARFTRSGISAGSQQIKQLGSGITGTDGTVSTYDTTVTGQADYNNAASIGDVHKLVQEKADIGTYVAGNNSTKSNLALGGTIFIQGSEVGLSATDTLADKLANDYSSANVTTQVSGSDGNVTTTVYLKKDLVGRSLTLGTIGTDGNVAASDRTASLYQAQSKADSDTAMTGHLFLAGEKRTAYADNSTVTHTSADIFVKDGSEGDNSKGYLTNPDLPVTRIYYTDEGNYTYALATMEDGFHAAGDSGKADILLNHTLNLKGGVTLDADHPADSLLTSGNIGVVADSSTNTLNLRLAKELTGLTSAAFTGDTTSLTVDGTGLKLTPNAGSSAKALTLTSDQIDLGGRKIQNVGSGTVAEGSTDGVNGGDVYKVQQKAEAAQTEAAKHTTVTVSGGNLGLESTANANGSTNYALKLNDKVTLGTETAKQITLDGANGTAAIGQQITLDSTTGKVTAGSFSTTGNVAAGSVSVGGMTLNSAESHPADKDKTQWVDKDTITGLSNVTYKADEIHESRAATEGQLQDVVSKIKSGDISGGALSSVSAGSNITVSSTPSADGKKTEYQVGLAKDLSGLTSASFTNGKTGSDEQTALVSAGGLSLGEGDAAARFTRSGISAGGQQVTKVGSGLQKVTDTSYLYNDTVAGQENYNHAANIGDVRTMLSDARDVFAGNNGTTATLTLGKTAAFQGADVALTGSQTLEEALASDYSKANLTARTVGNSDGSVTTSLYMKQDMVGRSLNLGNIGTDGTVADPAARLYTQAASDMDSTLTGHLKLTGIKEAQDGQTSSASADIYVKNALGSDLTDKNRAVTRLMYRDGVDQRDHTVATLDDGFYVQGDANQGNTLNLPLTSTLKIQGNTAAGSGLTAGNIGVVSDGKDTLKVQLADTLTGLKQISFADSAVSLGQEGIDAGGKAISGVAAGTAETDAVNVKQLDEAKAAASAEVKAGKNVTVSKDTASAKDGHTIYTVAADFQGADVSGSNAVVYDSEAKDQVTLGGSTSATPVKLTNLADGTISSTSTDAVTGRQLNEVITYRNQAINVAGDRGSAVKLNHGNTLTISGDSNISTSSSGSDTAKDGSLQVSLADNVYVKGIHIGSTYPTHSDTSVDSVALTADAENQTGILTLRGDATHVSDTYPRAQADISVLSAAPDQTYMAAPFLQEVYQTNGSGTITKNQPVRLAYRDNYNTAHQIATLDDGYVFSGDNGDKNLTEKLNGTVALRGMDNTHASQITSDTANTYLTKNNIGVVTKPKVLNEDGSTQGGEVEIRLAKDLTGLSSATFTNDNGDTAVLSSTALTLTPENAAQKPVSLTNQGLDNGNNRITNVAAGTSDTDAVNYGQIKSIINAGDGKIKGLTFAAGDNTSATVHLGDTLKIAGATDQDGAQNIHTTVKDGTMTLQLDRKVQVDELHVGQKGSDAASLTAVKLEGEAGSIGQLHLQGMENAQANIMTKMGTASLASTDAATTRLTYNNGNVGNTHEIAILEDGLRFTGDNYAAASGDKAEQNVLKKQLNQTLSITGGQTDTQQLTALTDKNIGVVAENGGLSVRLSKVLDGMTDIYMGDSRENASHLTKTGLYLSPKSSTEYLAKFTADDGISAGSQTISDVADGVKDSDAATYGQLKNVEAKANNATKLTVNHNQAEGNLTLTDTLDADGIHHTYDVALSDKIKLGSGGAGSSITLDGNANTINGGSYVQFGGDGDSKTSPLAIGWQSASLQDVITEEAKGSQTGNYLTGLSNTSWDPVNVGYSPNRAATEGQLRDLEKQVWENPITFLGNHDADKTAEESKGITAQLGSKIRIVGTGIGDGDTFDGSNLSVVAGKTSDGQEDALIIQMKKAPSFEAVHVGAPNNQGVYPVNVDGTGLRITNGPSITSSGIMAGDQRITSLASGGGKDAEGKPIYDLDKYGQNAANIQDVRNIANDAVNTAVGSFTIGGGKNIDVVHPQGTNQYTVALKDHVALGTDERGVDLDGTKGTIQAGSSTSGVRIDGNAGTIRAGESLTLDGNNGTLSGLTNTTITTPDFATKGRAATEEQLKQVADNVSEIKKNNSDFQLVGEKDQEGNYTGDYKVSDDNQVKLHVQDKMHPDQVKDITIDNVAKASDLGDVSKISEDIQNKENNNVADALNNLNQKVKDAANGSWESQINGETVKKVKAGDVQNFTSGDNIELSNDNGAIKIATKKDVSFDKVTIGSGDSKMTLDKDGLQAGKVKVSSEGINAGGNRIQGVADGKEKDDAATVGQLQKIAGSAGQAINELGNHLNRMDTRINRVGAGAAALAALHPVETDGRWSLSAGFGSYRNANSLAFGTFYRASDNVLFNMGATVGNGENMINAGFSIALDRNPAVTGMTKAAMAREIRTLKQDNQAKDAQVKDLQNQVDALKKENDDTKAKLALIMAKLGM
ncbi:ESPR-type extended signal peptide-containing protein [Acidaminococcus massiliensis]|uniref:ESPR-type extended signal peptide-containing protein n=1 Tax=Acidaminococcus massiliensis TaxID=1852375 RepID=UPI0022E5D7F1|nr:ESPR-type extended signal peptide-containing protein [Acidaminococcus massiliensis]